MPGISGELLRRLRDTLSRSGLFDNDSVLRDGFVDSRISQWQSGIPNASSPAQRVDRTINYLLSKHNTAGENALVLFLRVAGEPVREGTKCHDELRLLADDLEEHVTPHRIPRPHSVTRFSIRWPFPGLRPFSAEYADLFYGRDKDASRIVSRVQEQQVVIVNGLPGIGKTSLMRAGVIPALEREKYRVVYTSVQDDLQDELVAAIRNYLPDSPERSTDWFAALTEWIRSHRNQAVVIIIDHFEHALGRNNTLLSSDAFLTGMSHLLGEPYYELVHIVIVVQAGWQYSLRKYIEQAIPRYDANLWIVDVDPLSPDAAATAITAPLQRCGVPYDQCVVDAIISELQSSISELPEGRFVHPIQLQIVLGALFRIAERSGASDAALNAGTYENSGGVKRILRSHLADTIGGDPEAWRVLGLFISPDGKSGVTRRQSELLAVPAGDRIGPVLDKLKEKGILDVQSEAQHSRDLNYRLSHECLVDDVMGYITHHSEYLDLKHADEWLAMGVQEWTTQGLLLEEERYFRIYRCRDQMKLDSEARALTLSSALEYGHHGMSYWLSRGACAEADLELVVTRLLSSEPGMRRRALKSLTTSPDPSEESEGVCQLCDELLNRRLAQHFRASGSGPERSASAQALWATGNRGPAQQRWQVAAIVARDWWRANALRVASYACTAALVLLLVLGGLLIRDRLQGTWYRISTLHAGPVPRLALDPTDAERIYVVTAGGPGPREGNSLYGGTLDNLKLISSGFSRSHPTAMTIADGKTARYIYLSAYSEGVYRSGDGGTSWEVLSNGLPSRGLSSLAVDPRDSDTLYGGTLDWRGVLYSNDAGDSWSFFDAYGDTYGARVSQLVFIAAEGGSLLQATEDGRIFEHDAVSGRWVLRFGLPKGGILAMTAAPSDNRYVYAGTNQGVMVQSIDGGKTWLVLGQIANEFEVSAITVNATSSEHVFAATYGEGGHKVWQSMDAGLNWSMLPLDGLPRGEVHSLVHTISGVLVAGTDTGLYALGELVQDARWNRVDINAPLASISQLAVSSASAGPVYAAVGASVFANDYGMEAMWYHGRGLRAETVRTIVADPVDPETAYAGVLLLGEWSVFRTRDSGRNWEQTGPLHIQPVPCDTTSLAATTLSNGNTRVYAGTLGCGVFRSDDGGNTWDEFGRTTCRSDVFEKSPVDARHLDVDAVDADLVYSATGQWFYVSLDGGRTWRSADLNGIGVTSSITGLATDSVIPKRVYLATGSSGLWWSDDAGITWNMSLSRHFVGTELTALAKVGGLEGTLLVGAANGEVWMTKDGGLRWLPIRGNLAVGHISSVVSNSAMQGRVLVATLVDGIHVYEPGHLFGPSTLIERVQ